MAKTIRQTVTDALRESGECEAVNAGLDPFTHCPDAPICGVLARTAMECGVPVGVVVDLDDPDWSPEPLL